MDKKEFILKTAKNASATPQQIFDIYNAFVKTITDALKSGDSVMLGSFGLFELKTVRESTDTGKETDETKDASVRRKVAFIPTKSLNARINS